MIVAVDVGFGDTKALGLNGRRAIFPSVVASRGGGFKVLDAIQGMDAASWIRQPSPERDSLIGVTALNEGAYPVGRRRCGWVLGPEYLALFEYAVGSVFKVSGDIEMAVVGLPVDDLKLGPQLAQRLTGPHTFSIDGHAGWKKVNIRSGRRRAAGCGRILRRGSGFARQKPCRPTPPGAGPSWT
jgi:hypothetical protein